MRERLSTLEAWATARYGEETPSIRTLRRWCREGNILPLPKKHGRTYYVADSAQYVSHNDPNYSRLARESAKAQ